MNKVVLVSIAFFFSATAFATSAFKCDTGIDQMNQQPMATFEITEENSFKEFVLDSDNRIWMTCALLDHKKQNQELDSLLVCQIGQIPEDAPQNYQNIVPAAFVAVEATSKSLSFDTKAYRSLGDDNYIPYVSCVQK